MKISIAWLLLICCSLSKQGNQEEQPDMIFSAFIESDYASHEVLFKVATVYQGKVGEYIALTLPQEIEIKPSVEYLITVNHDLNTNILVITEAIPVNEATAQIQKLFYKIRCIDSTKITKGACHRDFAPVCGCDGKNYGNLCEAGRAGVNIYTHGRCK